MSAMGRPGEFSHWNEWRFEEGERTQVNFKRRAVLGVMITLLGWRGGGRVGGGDVVFIVN